MTDIKSKEKRSKNMAAIRSKDTKPEVFLRKKLFSMGYRYRVHSTAAMGHPDLYLRKYNTAIFVHGCFWHQHKGCKYAYMPKSNVEFWKAKFEANQKRDSSVTQRNRESGIKQLIVWECTIKKMKKEQSYAEIILKKIELFLHSPEEYMEL